MNASRPTSSRTRSRQTRITLPTRPTRALAEQPTAAHPIGSPIRGARRDAEARHHLARQAGRSAAQDGHAVRTLYPYAKCSSYLVRESPTSYWRSGATFDWKEPLRAVQVSAALEPAARRAVLLRESYVRSRWRSTHVGRCRKRSASPTLCGRRARRRDLCSPGSSRLGYPRSAVAAVLLRACQPSELRSRVELHDRGCRGSM